MRRRPLAYIRFIKFNKVLVKLNKLEPSPGRADTGNLEQDLPELLVAVAEAARQRDSAIALFVDEVQYLSRDELAALVVACHEIAQRSLPLMFIGAGLPQCRVHNVEAVVAPSQIPYRNW